MPLEDIKEITASGSQSSEQRQPDRRLVVARLILTTCLAWFPAAIGGQAAVYSPRITSDRHADTYSLKTFAALRPADFVVERCLFYNDRPKRFSGNPTDRPDHFNDNYIGGIALGNSYRSRTISRTAPICAGNRAAASSNAATGWEGSPSSSPTRRRASCISSGRSQCRRGRSSGGPRHPMISTVIRAAPIPSRGRMRSRNLEPGRVPERT